MTKQTTSPRFAKKIAALKEAFDDDKCSHCGEAGNFLCTDDHHRFTPLCDDCYYDDEIREATRWKPEVGAN